MNSVEERGKKLRRFSDEDLIIRHNKGLTDKEIAMELKVTQSAVSYRREKLGLKNNYVRKFPFTKEQLKERLDAAMSSRQIGKEFGCSPATVDYWKDRWELTRRMK